MKKIFLLTATLLLLMVGFNNNIFAQTTITVSGAGTSHFDGVYIENGTANGRPRYSKGTSHQIIWGLDGAGWWLHWIDGVWAQYINYSDTPTPPTVGWTTVYGGVLPVPTFTFGTLPVELTSFTATAKNNLVELKWNTATEINNFGFEIEKSRIQNTEVSSQNTAKAWQKIGFVEGNGTTNSPKAYSFVDQSAQGKTAYRLKQIDRDGKFEYSQEIEVVISQIPQMFSLMQNYPNPFNPVTMINYQLPINSLATLKVYDALGREAATLVNETKEAGTYSAKFDGSKLSSGIYFYTLQAGNFIATKKLTLMK
ncbi:MAG: T9SS type A sorting domain-containing protein [Bacteroidota bacterium]|nr:T9SS type A sorting domain-containing protein [Bacteroidota bacterium]